VTTPAVRRARLLTGAALAVTAAGVVLAVLQPPWLTEPLRDAVLGAGAAGPVVFVLLCVLAAPLHLTGLLTALSIVVWPLPVAAALSYAGGVLGCVVTAAALAGAGAHRSRGLDGWPGWLERLTGRVSRRPLLVGTTVRFLLQTGVAVEAFFLLTGYTRGRYLLVTAVGYALYVAQALLGIVALAALVRVSPWLGGLLAVLPLAAVGVVAVRRVRAQRAGTPSSR
jgi:hypothetical protein